MRILHTSDWHLGRAFHGFSRLEHQAEVLEDLVATVRDEHVDLVVIAGDLYDRTVPPADAIGLCDHLLAELRGTGALVVAIAGNHDSGPRLGFGEALMTAGGVTIRGDARRADSPLVVDADDGGAPLACFLVPYLEPQLARHSLGVPDARTQGAVWHEMQRRLDAARASMDTHRSLLVAHAFVAGGASSDSEQQLSVGGSEQVEPAVMYGFDYVALGHLHRAQSIGRGTMRYSGSPLAYSFSEADDRKQAWLVDMAPDGTVDVEAVPLREPRALTTIRGTLEDLLGDPALAPAEPAWVRAELTDLVPPRDPRERLATRFPHIAQLILDPPIRTEATAASYRDRTAGRTDLELTVEFLNSTAGIEVDDDSSADLAAAFSHVQLAEQLR